MSETIDVCSLGTVDISVPGEPLALDPIALSASAQLPEQFPFNLDYNSGDTIGFSEFSNH